VGGFGAGLEVGLSKGSIGVLLGQVAFGIQRLLAQGFQHLLASFF